MDSLRYHRWKEEARRKQTRIQHRSLDATGVELDKPAMVILGDPGSGKTTLLHYLALRAIRSEQAEAGHPTGTGELVGGAKKGRLPIFVPLAAYDEYLRRTDGTATLEQFLAIYYARWRNLRGMEPLFQQALDKGRALILFDGLDEVLELTTRQFVAQQVSGMLRQWESRGNRFVLTSRFIGYREVQLPGELPHYMVLDFRPEEIKQFARKWCEAFEVWAVGGRRSEVALQRAQQEEQALLADVNSKPSVAHLASNPLLLTMLALLRRQVGQLPARRIELYERYVRTLLDHWEVSRSEGARQQAPDRLEPNVAQQHLMDLALWLQMNRSSGTARQRDMIRALAEKALRIEDKNPESATTRELEEAERRATRCIQEVRDIAGLLGERGQDAYGFLHLTFQEYFVGRALARESPERRWELLLPHLHDPRWHEPILLCAGQLGVVEGREEIVADLVGRILRAESEHEDVLHRNLFLATAVIADDATRSSRMLGELMVRLEALRLAPVPSVRQQALAGIVQLMRLGHKPAQERFLAWIDDRTHLVETIRAFAKASPNATYANICRKLIGRLNDEDWQVRAAAVQALGAVAGSDEVVQESLLELLGDWNPYVQTVLVEALGSIAGSNKRVKEALLSRLNDEDADVRAAAAGTLATLVGSDIRVREALLLRFNDEAADVRAAAVEALGAIADGERTVRDALLGRLSDEDSGVRTAAVEALGALADSDKDVREELLVLLGDEEWQVRRAVAGALESAASSDEAIRDALLEQLRDRNPYAQSAVVEALESMVRSDEAVRGALVDRLGDDDWQGRTAAVEALGAVVGSNSTVREALLGTLGDESLQVRRVAAKALGSIAGSDEAVRTALLCQLSNTSSTVQAATVEVLGTTARSDEAVRATLTERLSGENWQVRRAAAKALGTIASSDEAARSALLDQLGDEDADVRIAVVGALGVVAFSDEAARTALLGRLGDEDADVRVAAVEALGAVAISNEAVRAAILNRLGDEASDVQVAALDALGSVAGSDEAVREALLGRLDDEDFDVLIAAVEALGAVAGCDEAVRESLLGLLGDEDSDVRVAAVEALGAVAGCDIAVRKALLGLLDDEDADVQASAMKALGTVAGSDKQVRAVLLGRLDDEDFDARAAAAEALGTVAGSDESVLAALLNQLSDEYWQVRSVAVEALGAVAGSNESVREALLSQFNDEHLQVRRAAVEALGAVAGSDESVLAALLNQLSDEHWQVRKAAVEALRAVAGSNESVQKALLNQLSDKYWQVRTAAVKTLSESVGAELEKNEFFVSWLGTVGNRQQEYLAEQVRRSVAQSVASNAILDERLIDRLLMMLRHPEWKTRQGAAMALMSMPGGPPPHVNIALRGLFDDVRDEGNWSGRLDIAEALLNVRDRKANEQAIDCAMSALDYGIQPWYDGVATGQVRSRAARLLGQLEPTYRNEQVLQRLLQLLQADDQEQVCDAAYHAALRLITAPADRSEPIVPTKIQRRMNVRATSILHLSDLHFSKREQADIWFDQLAEDLNRDLKCRQLDGAILSGDITNKSLQEGFDAALLFLQKLCGEFNLSPLQVVLVPGNHDLCRTAAQEAYRLTRTKSSDKLPEEGTFISQSGGIIEVREEAEYKKRFERFAKFYEQFKGEPYPLDYEDQGILYHFPEADLLVLGLNSAWNLDHHYTTRASINPNALNHPLARLRRDEEKYRNCRKLAVWHHPLGGAGEDRIKDHGFLQRLSVADFRLVLHGHIHKAENSLYRYDHTVGGRRLEVVGAGTFGAPVQEWPSGIPLQYNLLRFQGSQVTVETRRREELNGSWKPDARWGGGAGKDPKPFYTLDLA